MAEMASPISSLFFLPRLWVPRRFLASFNERFWVPAEPIFSSSIMRFSYGAKPTTSRITSRMTLTRLLHFLRLTGLGGRDRLVTMNPLLSPAARPLAASFAIAWYANIGTWWIRQLFNPKKTDSLSLVHILSEVVGSGKCRTNLLRCHWGILGKICSIFPLEKFDAILGVRCTAKMAVRSRLPVLGLPQGQPRCNCTRTAIK